MGLSRLLLFVTVMTIAVASFAAFFQHLVYREVAPFSSGVILGFVCAVAAAIGLKRSGKHDLRH